MAKSMTRFSVAIHILAKLEIHKRERNTSDELAVGLGTNSTFVRRVTGLLGKAGLVEGRPGTGGNRLLKSVEQITLHEVFQAVQFSRESKGFSEFSGLNMYQAPDEEELEGALIHGAMKDIFAGVEKAIEDELGLATIADVVMEVRRRMSSPEYKTSLSNLIHLEKRLP
jgi:DNA-binding IscR family transcriptional regulator